MKKKKIYILWYIWICILTFAILNSITQSKYVNITGNNKAVVEVAKPIVTISKTSLTSNSNNSLKKEIAFTVQNYDLENTQQRTEVPMSYYLTIEKKEFLPVNFVLYEVDEGNRQEIQLNGNKTESRVLSYTHNTQYSYILELTFTAPPSNEDVEDAISVSMSAKQVQ